jgi:hypothetical protein
MDTLLVIDDSTLKVVVPSFCGKEPNCSYEAIGNFVHGRYFERELPNARDTV